MKLYDKDGDGGGGPNDGDDDFQFFEEGDAGSEGAGDAGKEKSQKVAYDFSKLKGVFDDDDVDEEKFVSKAKSLKSENENLRILAQGREAIEKDEEVQHYRGLLRSNDDSLAYLYHTNRFLKGGLDKVSAEAKATAYIEKLKAKGPDGLSEIEEIALEARGNIRERISAKEASVLDKIKSAQSSVDLRPKDSKAIENSKNAVAKLEKFLGFKLPANHKDKIVKEAQDYIGSEQELKDLSDPELRAKWAMLVKHEKQWEKNVEARKSGKSAVISKAIANPRLAQSRGPKPITNANTSQGKGRIMKNPGAFLG